MFLGGKILFFCPNLIKFYSNLPNLSKFTQFGQILPEFAKKNLVGNLRHPVLHLPPYTLQLLRHPVSTYCSLQPSGIIESNQNQTFHYTRRITPKRVTSWRCPSPAS